MPQRAPRIQLCFTPSEHADLHAGAVAADLPLSVYIRRLALRARRLEAGSRDPDGAVVGLAALTAAEHALVLLETLLPDGASRSIELREDAIRAAEERIAGIREQLSAGWPL